MKCVQQGAFNDDDGYAEVYSEWGNLIRTLLPSSANQMPRRIHRSVVQPMKVRLTPSSKCLLSSAMMNSHNSEIAPMQFKIGDRVRFVPYDEYPTHFIEGEIVSFETDLPRLKMRDYFWQTDEGRRWRRASSDPLDKFFTTCAIARCAKIENFS